MRVAVYGKQFGEGFFSYCSILLKHLNDAGAELFIHQSFYDFLVAQVGLKPGCCELFSDFHDLPDCDLLFSIGGDGTFLDAVTMVRHRHIPIVGVNSGRLGFLADISKEELPVAVAEIMEGRYLVRELDLLKLETSVPCFGDLDFALNELAVQKRDSSSMITIHAYLNQEFLNSYWADGLIVSTATGSTAYSLSVGGPIMHPASRSFRSELDLLKLETSVPCFGDLDFALNELAVQKRDSSSMITIHAYLNQEFLNSYWADGLIVSTATGSTAYSLSVGGPIMHPASRSFIINPIAPHNLTVRPLVVPSDFELLLKVEARGGKFLASLDLRSCILDEGLELKVSKADFSVPVIERTGKSFYTTLRSKLMWGADKRN